MAAEAAVSSAVQLLGNLLVQKVNFLQGVEEEVQWLKDELKRMQFFLKDAAKKQAEDERVRNWISEIREVAYDAEDAIGIFILKRESSGLLGRFACFPGHLYRLNKVGNEIESIKKRLQDIESSRMRYGIKVSGEGSESTRRLENVERRRRLVPWQKDKHLVGLDEDVEQLLQKSILEKKKGLMISAIVGMGGIGKSTLARKIYNHAAVAAEFGCRAWVVVSSEFAAEDIVKQLMLQLQSSKDDRDRLKDVESIKDKLRREELLQEMLHKELEGKTYFIVLDDVWERTHWEYLRGAFPDDQDRTSRLLFTSRNQLITEHHGYIHKMRLLNQDDSWELLLKTAFLDKNDGKCPQELESIGREILKKCHGLPLAIAVAGGLLVNEGKFKSGWERVLKQIKNCHFETNEISSNVSAILELSYHNLPPKLKACFLCLGFFEEDAIIRAKRLVHIWVAQGFISSEEVGGGETMEEIAMSYLDELINRNLVQVKDMGTGDRGKNCLVHDLLHELSIKKAKEEIGLEILREEGNSPKSSYKPRHRVFHYCNGKSIILESSNHNKPVRSLFFHVHGDLDAYPNISSYWKSFGLLRILDVEANRLRGLGSEFHALIGLRYLRLREVKPINLPRWLDRLQNLEVLDINGYVDLPTVKWKIDSLRHFYAGRISGPMKIDNWKNLETLKYISSEDWMPDTTEMACCRVRKLGVVVAAGTEVSVLRTSLEKMENLVQLHLDYSNAPHSLIPIPLDQLDHLTKLKLGGPIIQCPAARMLPKNLSYLTLKRTYIIDDPMPELGKLPKLLHLKLYGPFFGNQMNVLQDGFPSLKVLCLQEMKCLRSMHIEEGGMPELQRFEIYHCPCFETEILREHLRSAAITTVN